MSSERAWWRRLGYAAVAIALLSAMVAPADGGRPDPNEREVGCFTIGVRGTKVRGYVCTQRSQCWRKERELAKHSRLESVEGCKAISPVWCFELAPRDELQRTHTVCQPTRAACIGERNAILRDVAPLPRRAKVRDTRCSKRAGAGFTPRPA